MVKHILLDIFFHINQNWPKLTLKLFQCNNPFFKESSRTWTWEDVFNYNQNKDHSNIFGHFLAYEPKTHHFLQELDFRTLSSSCKHTAVFLFVFGLCRHREAETHSRSWYLVCMWAYASLTSSNREGVLTTNHRKPLIQKDSKAEQSKSTAEVILASPND